MTSPTPAHGPEFYRDRAAEMREDAKRAANDTLAKLYTAMAKQWDELAEAAEALRKRKTPEA